MNPKKFLTIGGIILLVIGVLGIVGLLGSISSAGFFHPPYWINWFHLFLGILVLTVSFLHAHKLQVGVTLFATIILMTIGILGLVFGPYIASRYNIPELADPSDHIVHLGIGLLALWGFLNRKNNLLT